MHNGFAHYSMMFFMKSKNSCCSRSCCTITIERARSLVVLWWRLLFIMAQELSRKCFTNDPHLSTVCLINWFSVTPSTIGKTTLCMMVDGWYNYSTLKIQKCGNDRNDAVRLCPL